MTAVLRRTVGTPTAGTVTLFSATDSSGNTIGQFRDVTVSNDRGEATARLSVGSTAYRGDVTITAEVDTGDGVVSGSVVVQIIDP